MLVANGVVFEALMEVEACQLGAFKFLLPVKRCQVSEFMRQQILDVLSISLHHLSKGVQTDVVPRYNALVLLSAYVIPDVEQIPIVGASFMIFAIKFCGLNKVLMMVYFIFVANRKIF
jgi:hypothetical protein